MDGASSRRQWRLSLIRTRRANAQLGRLQSSAASSLARSRRTCNAAASPGMISGFKVQKSALPMFFCYSFQHGLILSQEGVLNCRARRFRHGHIISPILASATYEVVRSCSCLWRHAMQDLDFVLALPWQSSRTAVVNTMIPAGCQLTSDPIIALCSAMEPFFEDARRRTTQVYPLSDNVSVAPEKPCFGTGYYAAQRIRMKIIRMGEVHNIIGRELVVGGRRNVQIITVSGVSSMKFSCELSLIGKVRFPSRSKFAEWRSTTGTTAPASVR